MNTIPYDKPHKTFEEQSALLCHSLIQDNPTDIEKVLRNINYYQIGLYIYPFRIDPTQNTLADNTKFSHALSLYNFDKRLRLVILDSLETIETAMKTQIAYKLGQLDKFFFYKHVNNENILMDKNNEWQQLSQKIIARLSTNKNTYIHSNYRRYTKLPTWIIIETLTMGEMGQVLEYLKPQISHPILMQLGIVRNGANTFITWWKQLNQLRNKCAHYDLVWNAKYPNFERRDYAYMDRLHGIQDLKKSDDFQNTLYSRLSIVWFWLQRIHPTSKWNYRLQQVLKTFPQNLPNNIILEKTGFLNGWNTEHFWNLS